MSNPEYQKIPGPFKRDPKTKQILPWEWTSEELRLTAGLEDWDFTEKIDGTNVRVFWDGYRVSYAGRTDRAEFSNSQREALDLAFAGPNNEVLFEQQFGNQAATLYGELYGPGVQKGGKYRDELSFALFDVRIEEWWLQRDAIEEIGANVGVETVPLILAESTVYAAIDLIRSDFYSDVADSNGQPRVFAEGVVGVLGSGLRNRKGDRIIVKVKHDDLHGISLEF